MTDDDLVSIVLENKISDEQYYELINIQVQDGESQEHTATVTLSGPTTKRLKKRVQEKEVLKRYIIR